MPFSLAELRFRAADFARSHADWHDEKAQAQDFWRDLLDVFVPHARRRLRFEQRVKKADGAQGFIDAFWPGLLLGEQKSRGKNLDRAFAQAQDYLPGLPAHQLPRYVLVSDFARLRLDDLDAGTSVTFALAELPDQLHHFGFLTGYRPGGGAPRPEDPANAEAAELMAQLHDRLLADGYAGHPLEVLLVRLLFCCFAEDTAIFEKDEFRALLEEHTAPDGHDTGPRLTQLFETLDTPAPARPPALPPYLRSLPYVNGALFRETFRMPAFSAEARAQLIRATYFDWSRISPAVFGSLFQAIADPARRRTLGAHYTSEANILKVLDPLLLDGLRAELAAAATNRARLTGLQTRLAGLRLLDPACGCGNFLVVAYRELRLLEHAVLERLYEQERALGRNINLALWQQVRPQQVAGLELEEFAARIAEVALWLVDHQLNLALSARFEQVYRRLPLVGGAVLHHTNALTFPWETAWADGRGADYIVGNPPFVGQAYQSEEQKTAMARLFAGNPMARSLDLVAAWYLKGAQFVAAYPATRVGFVSTNSVTQGEQVAPLWGEILGRYKLHIQFAHRTFAWSNEARGNAAVYCVIIGYGADALPVRRLFDYATPRSAPQELQVGVINAYLVDGPEVVIANRSQPLANVPTLARGSMPTDGGNLILSDEEKAELVAQEPDAARFIRRYVGAQEFLHNESRWCLWLENITPTELRTMPRVAARVDAVRKFRLASKAPTTREFAKYPTLFRQSAQPKTDYLVVPLVSSENRQYVPIGFMPQEIVVSNLVGVIPAATPYLFGLLTSEMHMAWLRHICGRLKSDFRYSGLLIYNNYPFPVAPTPSQVAAVETAARAVLAARAQFPTETLATLYDPRLMPPALAAAHATLDRAVDRCYRPAPFATELARLEHLFERYQALTAPLLPVAAPARRKSA